jgi:hypothetical protein
MCALEKLPPDAPEEDVLYQIFVVLKIDRGLEAGRAGKIVPVDDVRDRLKNWSR